MERNLMDIIDKMLTRIPNTEIELKSQLADNKSSMSCASPELMYFLWNEVYKTLWNNIPSEPVEEWQYEILSIFSTKSVHELKMRYIMKIMTVDQLLAIDYWGYSADKIQEIFNTKETWTALDILRVTQISAYDRIYLVLREDLIDARILHEAACQFAERALKCIDNPDSCSVAAITAKREWLQGKISDKELMIANDAAKAVYDAAYNTSRNDIEVAARTAYNADKEGKTYYNYAAHYFIYYATRRDAYAAAWLASSTTITSNAAWRVAEAVYDDGEDGEKEAQVEILITLMEQAHINKGGV